MNVIQALEIGESLCASEAEQVLAGEVRELREQLAQALLGLWGGVDLVVDPYSKAEYGLARFIASQMLIS